MKSKTTAIILSALLGGLGVDRFYLGYTGIGILKLLTAGCLGVLYIIDLINIATGRLLPADGLGYEDDIGAAQSKPSPFEDLEKLAKLHEQGVISDGEYEAMKAKCMTQI